MSNKFQYLKEYFYLIDLYQKKDNIMQRAESYYDYNPERMIFAEEQSPAEKLRKTKIENSLKSIEEQIKNKENELKQKEEKNAESNPALKLKQKYKLDDTEIKILILFLKQGIYPVIRIRPFANDILKFFFTDPIKILENRKYFANNAKLIKNKLLVKVYHRIGRMEELEIPEQTVNSLLGEKSTNKRKTSLPEKSPINLEQVVLKPQVKNEIIKCLSQVRNEKLIFQQWGFSELIKYGKGVTMLFVGPPGTGKTMTAQAVANYLKRELYLADLSTIKDKWLGETEKRIVSIFKTASYKKAVLFFDEADSILYSRMDDVQHSIDIAYNQWTNIILQEIEKFSGVIIFATNKSKGMDEAFERRISLKIEFEIPAAELREQIWKNHIPAQAPLSIHIDFKKLAEDFEFAGGHIKNVVLNAARSTSTRDTNVQITMQDLYEAALKEQSGESFFKDLKKVGFRNVS